MLMVMSPSSWPVITGCAVGRVGEEVEGEAVRRVLLLARERQAEAV